MDVPIFKRIQIYASALFMLVILFLRDGIITVRSVLGLGEKSSLGKIFKVYAYYTFIQMLPNLFSVRDPLLLPFFCATHNEK